MSTFTGLYINTDNEPAVIDKMKALSGIEKLSSGPYPKDLRNNYLFEALAMPDYMAIAKTQAGWTTVRHNSFNKLVDWATDISQTFNCRVIVLMAQSTSDAYYFALYEAGKKLREIEVCYSEDFDVVNWGDKFPFEGAQIGKSTEHGYIFDYDALEEYSAHFGLEINGKDESVSWQKLEGEKKRFTVGDYIDKHLTQKKPWWQFW